MQPVVSTGTSRGRRASYAKGPTEPPLLDETIGENLRRTVERFGEREALVVGHQGYRASYRELWDQVDLAARALIANGVRNGDRVGVWAPNRYEWVVLQFATARVGAILVNINPANKSAELEYALRQAGVSVLVMARGFRGADHVALLEPVRAARPELRLVLVLEHDWEIFLAEGACVDEHALAAIEATLDPRDPINIQYTPGTTGSPKGATLSHRNILNNGRFVARTLRYSERDRVCVPVPFYHGFGMVIGTLACVTHGACVVVPGESFDPHDVLAAVPAKRCTSLYGVPTMFIAELEQLEREDFDLTSLRTGIIAGAPCPVELINQVRSRLHMPELTIACVMTETSAISTQTSLDDPLEKRLTTVGRVHPHLEVKVIDPDTGETVPRGTPGEQCTRGYSVMTGYWNDPQATSGAIDADGWMHSGDLAVMDEHGYLTIVGRIKDTIIRGGENIYPREVEELLHRLPEISQAQVIGVPSERYGEEVMAWVQLREGATVTEERLAAACYGQIATHKIPRYWWIVDSFPMTVTGQIQKHRMREIATEQLGLTPEAQRAAAGHERPAMVKADYHPTNLFHPDHNVEPAA